MYNLKVMKICETLDKNEREVNNDVHYFDLKKVIVDFEKRKKVENGQFFTIYNPFENLPFIEWFKMAMSNAKNKVILEPFAGANNLIHTLLKKYNFEYKSYDIEPRDNNVEFRDTLLNFPKGYSIIVTNPPYLAKNSAKRKGLESNFIYDDLYKDCLEKMLKNCEFVAAIIPATFLHWGKYQERLFAYVMLTEKMFNDTENPVCLALFTPNHQPKKLFYLNDKKLCIDEDILNYELKNFEIRFNESSTCNLALYAIDGNRNPNIKFIKPNQINLSEIKNTSRNIVCISIVGQDVDDSFIEKLNHKVFSYRKETCDLFLTPFKGVRKDGVFRRRMTFKQARAIIEDVLLND